ncbi:MAG: hypothetical protein ACLFTZ_01160 [Acholeplasmataceae bacterium]
MKKRMTIALAMGALLGVFCIIGASVRTGPDADYLFAFWYNRLLMGFVVGLLPFERVFRRMVARGALIGLFVSFAFYSATGYADLLGFAVGAVYGIIIEYASVRFVRSDVR